MNQVESILQITTALAHGYLNLYPITTATLQQNVLVNSYGRHVQI